MPALGGGVGGSSFNRFNNWIFGEIVQSTDMAQTVEAILDHDGDDSGMFFGVDAFQSGDRPLQVVMNVGGTQVTVGGSGQACTLQKRRCVELPSANLALTGNGTANPRIDLVVGMPNEVQTAHYTGSVKDIGGVVHAGQDLYRIAPSATFEIVLGTAAPNPVAPVVPSGWDAVAAIFMPASSVAPTQANVKIVLPTLASVMRDALKNWLPVYCVDAYGAVGDQATDDTNVWAHCVSLAVAAKGGIVLGGPKGYAITALSISGDAVWLMGIGRGSDSAALQPYTLNGGTALIALGGSVDIVTFHDCTGGGVERLSIRGREGSAPTAGVGLHVTNVPGFRARDVLVKNTFDGVIVDGQWDDVLLDDVRCVNIYGTRGIHFNGPTSGGALSTRGVMRNCRVVNNGSISLPSTSGSYQTAISFDTGLQDCAAEDCYVNRSYIGFRVTNSLTGGSAPYDPSRIKISGRAVNCLGSGMRVEYGTDLDLAVLVYNCGTLGSFFQDGYTIAPGGSQGVARIRIHNAEARGCYGSGIRSQGTNATDIVIEDSIFEGNNVGNVGAGGVDIYNTVGLNLSNNVFGHPSSEPQTFGVRIDSTCDKFIVTDNMMWAQANGVVDGTFGNAAISKVIARNAGYNGLGQKAVAAFTTGAPFANPYACDGDLYLQWTTTGGSATAVASIKIAPPGGFAGLSGLPIDYTTGFAHVWVPTGSVVEVAFTGPQPTAEWVVA